MAYFFPIKVECQGKLLERFQLLDCEDTVIIYALIQEKIKTNMLFYITVVQNIKMELPYKLEYKPTFSNPPSSYT